MGVQSHVERTEQELESLDGALAALRVETVDRLDEARQKSEAYADSAASQAKAEVRSAPPPPAAAAPLALRPPAPPPHATNPPAFDHTGARGPRQGCAEL